MTGAASGLRFPAGRLHRDGCRRLGPSRLAHWGKLPRLLAERLFVVTYDCRNIGGSERRDEPYTVRDEVEDATFDVNEAIYQARNRTD